MNPTEEKWRAEFVRRLSAGRTISGKPSSAWPEPPIDAKGLIDSAELRRSRSLMPGGPLRGMLGPRIEAEQLFDGDRHDETDLDPSTGVLHRIVAYPVLPLLGVKFMVTDVEGIADAVRGVLAERLPGIDWWVPQYWEGPFLKYGILHNSLPAPPNPMTGEPMAIEVFGQAERVMQPGSVEDEEAQREWRLRPGDRSEMPPRVLLPTAVTVQVATYANVRYPGVGVPLYL